MKKIFKVLVAGMIMLSFGVVFAAKYYKAPAYLNFSTKGEKVKSRRNIYVQRSNVALKRRHRTDYDPQDYVRWRDYEVTDYTEPAPEDEGRRRS